MMSSSQARLGHHLVTSFENRLEILQERCLNFDLVLNILNQELLMKNLFLLKLIEN